MNTNWFAAHKHSISGKPTTATAGHSHELDEVEAAIAVLMARLNKLEGTAPPPVEPPPVEPPPRPPPPPPPPPAGLTRINVASGGKGVTVTKNGQVVENLEIVGPGCSTNGSTYGIYGSGAFSGVVIRNCTIRGFDYDGICLIGLSNATIENCTIEDVSYTGIMLISVIGGVVRGNTIRRVGVITSPQDGTTHNAYGIAATDTGGTRSTDILIEGNTVTDVPRWHGLDTHHGLRITFKRNTVRRCPRAVFVTLNATECVIDGNLLTEPTPFTNANFGTNPEAMTAANTVNCRFTNNVIGAAYGAPKVYDYNNASTGLVQSGNVTGETLP